ncbi:MAG: chemotaxis response regulator protein-glutamate methylesterase [Treponema sp.]|nr:chemotaxis response regulator protein-glutamate methylesterase [Treponema sp.]
MDDISVFICDDSALMRNLITRIIDGTPGMTVVGKAMNGQFAVEKIPALKPDVMVLDIEMPIMNGIEFLKKRKELHWDFPVVVLSSVATEGAAITIQALELGAADFLTKPNGSISADLSAVADRLTELLSSYGGQYARRHGKNPYPADFFMHQAKLRKAEHLVAEKKGEDFLTATRHSTSKLDSLSSRLKDSKLPSSSSTSTQAAPVLWNRPAVKKEPAVITPLRNGGRIEVIAIGISTGGPNALREVFKDLDPALKQPILVVQHMPAGFTAEFANSLNRICPLDVKEAADGDVLEKGHVYIAPGNYHIYVEKKFSGYVVRLSQEEQRNGHRPSADVLFESVAKIFQNRALGVIMTGMGRDGAVEITEMRKQGAWTLGQDEDSSVVYGMPKVAWELGGVQKQVALKDMANAINKTAFEHS